MSTSITGNLQRTSIPENIGCAGQPVEYKMLFSIAFYPWVAMALAILIWTQFASGSANTLGNIHNFYRIFFVVSAGILAPLLAMKNSRQMFAALNTPLVLLFIYGLVALISSTLVPTHSFYTMWKSLEIMIDVFAIVCILSFSMSTASAYTAYRYLMLIFSLLLFLVIAGALVDPGSAFRSSRGLVPVMLQGYFPVLNPNSLGFICAILFIHNLGILNRAPLKWRKLLAIAFMISSIGALILAQSRTSTVATILGLGIYLYFDRRRMVATMIFGLAAIVLLFTAASDIFIGYLERGQSTELMTTLSGRTHGWSAAWELYQQAPVFGHGFAAAARTEILGITGGASTLHGSLFDVIVGVGTAGLLPWAGALLITLFMMAKMTRRRVIDKLDRVHRSINAEFLAITAMLVIRTATNSGVAMHSHEFMLFLCVIAYIYTMKASLNHKTTPRPALQPG